MMEKCVLSVAAGFLLATLAGYPCCFLFGGKRIPDGSILQGQRALYEGSADPSHGNRPSLSEVTNDIEWLEGTFRDLGKRIEMATLSVNIRFIYSAEPSSPTLVRRFFTLAGKGRKNPGTGS